MKWHKPAAGAAAADDAQYILFVAGMPGYITCQGISLVSSPGALGAVCYSQEMSGCLEAKEQVQMPEVGVLMPQVLE